MVFYFSIPPDPPVKLFLALRVYSGFPDSSLIRFSNSFSFKIGVLFFFAAAYFEP